VYVCSGVCLHRRDSDHLKSVCVRESKYVCVYVYEECVCTKETPMHRLTMGWLRLVGSLKLLVSFAKEPYKRDNILQKRPMILRSILIAATP